MGKRGKLFPARKLDCGTPLARADAYAHRRNIRFRRANRYDRPSSDARGEAASMRINHLEGGALRRWIAAGAACGVAWIAALSGAAEEHPSLAKAISYESAELWQPGDAPAPEPLEDAYYSTADAVEPLVAASSESCPTCNGGGGYPYNRCGCSNYALFPWFTGPGACDTWCVGPHWEVSVDGLIMFRDTVDWSSVPPGVFTLDVADQFDNGPGARVFVTGYNENRFGMQVGYEGVNDFHANALFSNGADMRTIAYESNFNSVEINFVRRTNTSWRPLAGVRYLELDENFVDFTTVDKPIPAPTDPPAPPTAFVDSGTSRLLENRLIGLQGGAFRDMWRLNRWVTFEPFGNAGVYFNDFKRVNLERTVTTVITGDDLSTPGNEFTQVTQEVQTTTTQEFSELSFVGEAGITGVVRLNRCVALRGGYQVLVVNGVGQGIDAFLAPGLDPTTLVYHGGHFGFEYVR